MLALGLQGSPRKKGNSDLLLAMFMDALQHRGAVTHTIEVTRRHIEACKELTVCEKKGFCPIDDDMGREIYGLLRQADIIVAASPIFFYNVTAQLKALIDRCQTLWARKYVLKLKDPGHGVRRRDLGQQRQGIADNHAAHLTYARIAHGDRIGDGGGVIYGGAGRLLADR